MKLTKLYFIRLSDNQDYYMHPQFDSKNMTSYIFKQGCKGAAVWEKEQGEDAIINISGGNVEMVSVESIIEKEK